MLIVKHAARGAVGAAGADVGTVGVDVAFLVNDGPPGVPEGWRSSLCCSRASG